jgi:signal transduction histidine kinase
VPVGAAFPPAADADLDAALQQIVGELCELLGADRATLYLFDERSEALEPRYAYVARDRQLYVPDPMPLRVGAERIWAHVSVSLEPMLIADAQHDPLIPNQERMQELGIVSILEVPLVVGARGIGMVALGRLATDPEFDDASLRVARSFATQAALAIENARLHRRAAKQAEQLALVNEVGRRIHAILDPEPLLDELAALITSSFHYAYTAICLVEGDELVVRAAHSAAAGQHARLIGLRLPLDGPSLAGWATRHDRPLLVPDVREHPDYFTTEDLPEAGSALAVPLPAWGDWRGALVVEATACGAFDAGDVTLMEALAGQITVALANAALYRAAADRAAALGAANARLAELDKLKSDFVSMVSHELRTPLGLIKGYVGTLLSPDLPLDSTTAREFLGVIDEETDALSDLVGNLLDTSRIESGILRIDPRPNDLHAIVSAAAEMLQARYPRRAVEVQVGPDLPPAWVDGRRIAQVLGNLLENAAKYSPEASPILIFAEPRHPLVCVTVRDHGPGIPADALPHLFDKFYRVPDAPIQAGGTGLGLTIARGIVEAHGGQIWVESTPGQGAAFSFTVPIAS